MSDSPYGDLRRCVIRSGRLTGETQISDHEAETAFDEGCGKQSHLSSKRYVMEMRPFVLIGLILDNTERHLLCTMCG